MIINNKEYTYYAFISYKREDEKWAKWLQKKLESYGFPVALRKDNPTLPAKIRPIFRDKSDLSGGNLKASIEKGLASSKYLIVICSPRAAKSPWVSKEVQYFIDHGEEDNIIPFIIGGIPNAANSEDECFPEGLRLLFGEKEILGININDMGRDAASIKVIARMFGLRFDTLWQRHERAKRRRRFAVIVGVILFALISFFIGAYMAFLNTQIRAERDRAEEQTKIATNERNRANTERDNTLKANLNLAQAKDSILKSYILLQQLTSDLNNTNLKLNKSRELLILEKNKLKESNFNMKVQYYKNIIANCKSLIEDDNLLLAARLLLNIDISDDMIDLIPDYESSLRLIQYKLNNPLPHKVSNIGNDIGDQREGFYISPYSGLKLSHKGDMCLICQDDVINVYSTQNGALLWSGAPGPTVYNVIFCNDDSHIIASDGEGNVYIYDVLQNKSLKIQHVHNSIIEDIITSKNNHIFSCAGDGLKEFDVNGNIIREYPSNFRLRKLKMSSDEKLIVASGEKGCLVYSTFSGELVKILSHDKWTSFGNFNNVGLVTYSDDKTVKIWDNEWNLIKTHYFDSWIKDAYFLNESNLVVRDSVGIWRQHVLLDKRNQIDVDISYFGTQENDVIVLVDKEESVTMDNLYRDFNFSIKKIGTLYEIDANDDLSIVAIATKFGKPSLYWNKSQYSLPDRINGITFNNNGFVITQKYATPNIAIMNDGILTPLKGEYKYSCNPIISPDQKTLMVSTSGNDSIVWLFDYPQGTLRHTLKHNYYVGKGSFISYGKNVVTLSNDSLWVWNTYSGDLLTSLGIEDDKVQSFWERESICDFFEDNKTSKIYVATDKGKLLEWDYLNNTIINNWQMQTNRTFIVPLKNKGGLLTYSWTNDTFYNYKDKTGKTTRIETTHRVPIKYMSVSPDVKFLATISDVGDVIIYNLDNLTPVKTIMTGYRNPGRFSYDKDGKYLLIATHQGIVSLYDINKEREILKIDNYNSDCELPVLSNQNELILLDGGVFMPIRIKELSDIIDNIKAVIGNYKLSQQEREKWGIIDF